MASTLSISYYTKKGIVRSLNFWEEQGSLQCPASQAGICPCPFSVYKAKIFYWPCSVSGTCSTRRCDIPPSSQGHGITSRKLSHSLLTLTLKNSPCEAVLRKGFAGPGEDPHPERKLAGRQAEGGSGEAGDGKGRGQHKASPRQGIPKQESNEHSG